MNSPKPQDRKKEFLFWLGLLLLVFCIGLGHGYYRKTQSAQNRAVIRWAITGYEMPQVLQNYLQNLFGVEIEFQKIASFKDFRTQFSTSDIVLAPIHWIRTLEKERLLRKLDPVLLNDAELSPEFKSLTIHESAVPFFWKLYKRAAKITNPPSSQLEETPDLMWTWIQNQDSYASLHTSEVSSWTPRLAELSQLSFERVQDLKEIDKEPVYLWAVGVTIPAHSNYKSMGQKILRELMRKDILLGWTEVHKIGSSFEALNQSELPEIAKPQSLRQIPLPLLRTIEKIPSSAEGAYSEAQRMQSANKANKPKSH